MNSENILTKKYVYFVKEEEKNIMVQQRTIQNTTIELQFDLLKTFVPPETKSNKSVEDYIKDSPRH